MLKWQWVGWNRATEMACIFKTATTTTTNKTKQNKPPNKIKNETGLLTHFWGGQEGMKSQAAYNKHLSLGLCLFCNFCFEETSTYHLSVAYECCVGISDSANVGFLPWVLRVCATKAPLKLNMEWVAGLWRASSTEDGFTVGQQQDFKWLLNRDEYFLASFPLLPRTVIEYLCHPFVLSQEPDPPRLLRRKTFYF